MLSLCLSPSVSFLILYIVCALQDCADFATLRRENLAMEEQCAALKLQIVDLEGQVKVLQSAMLATGGE